ncbi:nidogen-2 isoform X31 [Hippocampus zosterae]|uniref:nidogen-2 isoform X30 n=1 Tax=Hippocampus zosterae TaxID=109293 RepID=UPI00223E152A|nr:nidogen-2 isoform X30 [Hippocampus zosterae]XP_051915069.1 nidogen-2 isoform X31 [Hippocampus zosterae]
MERGQMVTVYLLGLCCSICSVAAIPRAQMFPYGMLSGDSLLEEGDDETSKVISLPKPFYFYDTPFYQLYVATNGFISAQDLPMETQYVDDGFPTDFPVVAPFLADMDTSGGRGQIFYRVTETPSVLNRVAQEVHRGFPDAKFTPTHAVVATWENVAAYEEPAGSSGGTSNKVNTFQAVIGYDESDSYALFLYPEGGLNFFGTRPKESFKVAIELAARVGFSRGEVTYLYFSRTEGPYYSVTSDEQSIKRLTQVGNTGIPGLWLFHTGNRYSFDNIVPASIGGILATPLPREPDHTLGATTPEYNDFEDYEDNSNFEPAHQEEDDDFPLTGEDLEFRPAVADETLQSRSSDLPLSASEVSHGGEDLPLTSEPRHGSEVAERQYVPPPLPPPQEAIPDGGAQWSQEQRPQIPVEVGHLYPPHRNEPPLSSGGHVVSVEEDVDFDTGVIHYTTENKETCARFQQQCSQNAFCSDYATGFCCHCQPGFYGNGRHCLPEAAPQRVSGKLSGTVTVGLTPVELNNIDLHAYIVVGDGRAYTAVSEIPEPVGWALMPAAPIGELFGWLFALELPNSQAGFKTTGAEFTRHAELVFYPGNQRLLISQTGRGLDENNHFTVDTALSGSVPFLPPAAEVTMDPFKETYHYYPSVATSNSVREFTVVSPDGGSESFSFQLKQNITYRDCRHDSRVPPLETQQITMERVFVMYVKEERILRYAITNKISPVGGAELVNPCYDGSHDCDTTAQCTPLEDKAFQCRCGTGYSGDGHNCQDIDECAEGLATCGAHSQCVNLPGSHRCRCQAGYEFGFDGRTCVDMDECRSSPCHVDARCTNSLGSFQCQCQNGFYGDGFLCSQQGQTGRTKSQCEEHRDRLQDGLEQLPVGVFVPQCDSDGRYRPLQCHGSTGHCWCVDSRGQERAGTRTTPGMAPTDCDRHEQPQQPKTQCEHHRDNVQTTSPEGYPIVGAFVPQCDANGRYTPQQCHGSTGHCWCVDSQGQERPGTRTPPGTTPIDCERPDDRPKTHCEQHRDSVQATSPLVGAFVPQCDANGQYTPLQCHGSTGHCWCVDSQGQERPRTRTSPGVPPTDCDKPDEPDHTKTHCERHRDSVQTTSPEGFPLVGAFVPQCDANGQYTPQQCHGSTGHCWCVDNRGQERPGTRTSAGSTPVDCDKPEQPKTQCEQHRDGVQTISPEGYPVAGAFVPQCDSNGHYTPLQCHGSTGHCWCVDSQGQERLGTRTLPGTTPTNCDKPEDPERLKTHCEQHRDSVQTTSPEGFPILGAFVPQCDANGQYTPQQCHGSSGHCWCVDNKGQERPGTRTPPGATPVDCAKPERPKSHCELHRDSIQTEGPEGYPPVGAFVPQCDANGHYTPRQCHGSSGHCWCVDGQGQERSGTRTPAGATPFDCEKAERPRSHCELHRDRIHTTSPEGHPLAGAYVPQCDANGQYIPQQCHGSTGHCWCVDSQGQERPGTRTPPGATPFDCDKPERPRSHCELHRDSIQTTSPAGHQLAGAYVPQCDANGQYIPQQCHGSTGHCWCVDSHGQERPGTRTHAGATPFDCDKPERPKSHCEHLRDSIQTTSPEGHQLAGAYVPQCDANGHYTPQQCHGSSGHCWCVDSQGQERPGTRTPPGATPFDCDQQERPKSHCEHQRDNILTTSPEGQPLAGAYVPQCDANGNYTPQQCHGSSGHCWCVDSQGQERSGTRTPPGATPFDCEKPERPKSHCEQHRESIQTTSPEGHQLAGAYVPQCDNNGHYTPRQCHGSSGHCWCVDSQGQERSGTRTPPGATPIDCNQPERPKSHCEQHRESIQTTSPGGHQLTGAYVPQCDANGHYTPQQCHGSTGHCWCVDSQGQERPGTRTRPGTTPIDCDKPEPPKSHCEQHRDSVQTTSPDGYPILGAFIPQCDANGQYTPQQCHGSSGHCWCVDNQGQERPGTRTPPGATPFNCDNQERPQTHCEQHRDRAQAPGPDGNPILGAFIPHCDTKGRYTSQQCHGSTGHCWCVDSHGQERPGTRTPPGTTPIDCERANQRPKTQCEHHRASIQTTSPEGYPLVGAFVPQCDAHGQYATQQCHGSIGQCWCVDSNGQERAGTRTPPGVPPVDCDAPVYVAPTERPESVCERWRSSLMEHYGGKPEPQQYLPQCEPDGQFSPIQCYGETTYCWCVDQDGREVPGTRSNDVVKPACLPSVAPPTVRPLPRPDVTPPSHSDVTLLYAQGQKIGALPLNGSRLDASRSRTLLTLHGSIVVGLSYDCKQNQVYWTDLSARTINRASMVPGAEPEILINSNLVSPEGLAVDVNRRLMFWVDSNPDLIERSNLDGSDRRTLFDRDLVNPRAIIVVSSTGSLYWTDWNREAPKIESASVDGQNRRVVVSEGIGLPNALTYDYSSGHICWADAGTKRLECVFPDGSRRRVINPSLNYPFSMVYHRNHFYYTDWRRDGVITVSKDSGKLTDEYLPDQRSHLYGIAIATSHCLSGNH